MLIDLGEFGRSKYVLGKKNAVRHNIEKYEES